MLRGGVSLRLDVHTRQVEVGEERAHRSVAHLRSVDGEVAQVAQRNHGREVTLYWLPSRPKLEHDVIDPGQPWARPGFVYPRLLALLEGVTPAER